MTTLVYQYLALSIGVPVIVGVIFTLFHAVVQSYVYTLLTSMFFGEASEDRELDGSALEQKPKQKKRKRGILNAEIKKA